MKTCKLVCAFLAIVFLISCSDENNKQSEEASVLTQLTEAELKVLLRMRDPNNRVSLDEAMKEANWVVDFLNGEGALKSGSKRKVNSISALVSDNANIALKSSDVDDIEFPDTLAYILNFNDSLGFAIISADTRIDDPMLAFTESGSLGDETDNPGIAVFLEHLEDYMLNSIVEAEQQYDSLIVGILEKLDIEIEIDTETNTKATEEETAAKAAARAAARAAKEAYEALYGKVIDLVQPLVPVEWGQRSPFNNNLGGQCNNGTGNNKYWAGCVATATAQIMSYWKYPSSINGYSFNWTELNQYKTYSNFDNAPTSSTVKSQVANLFQQIGKGVGMSYGCDKSGAESSDAIKFLRKLGFSVGGLVGYNSTDAINSMKRGEPLIVRGCSKKIKHKFLGITIYTTYDGCHAWVIDGYMKRRRAVNGVNYDYDYIRNNWGWNGSYNGYYNSGVFNSRLGPSFSSETTKSSEYTEESGEDKNYQYDIKMASYIRR